MKTRLIAPLVIGAFLLSGCASNPDSGEPAPSEPTDIPTPTSVAPEEDDPAAWVVGYEGVGPVHWGESVDEARGLLTDFTETPIEECPALAVFESQTLPNVWLVLGDDGLTADQVVITADSADAISESPLTAEGIGVGSSVDDVIAAYPDAEVGEVAVADTRYSVTDGTGWINIVVRDGVVHEIVVRDEAAVSYEVCG
ncbi:MAG: hypothetical protein ACOH19_09815 [Rhodoglobus sp.]